MRTRGVQGIFGKIVLVQREYLAGLRVGELGEPVGALGGRRRGVGDGRSTVGHGQSTGRIRGMRLSICTPEGDCKNRTGLSPFGTPDKQRLATRKMEEIGERSAQASWVS